MIGAKHDSNNELIGQGIANIFSPLFGGLPATGAIARTATNINNGGRTPVAGIIHAMVLLLIMIFFGKYVEFIPMAALAAVLIQVAWNMAGIPSIRKLLKGQKSDITVLLVTFLITVFVDLTSESDCYLQHFSSSRKSSTFQKFRMEAEQSLLESAVTVQQKQLTFQRV